MATPEHSASCISNREVTDAPQQRFGKTKVFALERMLAPCLCSLLLILVFPGLAPAQDTFSSGSGTSAAPTTYGDQFASSCEESEPPNVFKQVGMNPLVCHGQVGPQDSQKECSYAGMKMIAHIGETCYYCAPIVPPMNGIIIPLDQVRNATNQGFSCYGDQVDPSCMSICTKPGSLKYNPPPISGVTPNPVPVTGGPPTNESGPMPGPAGGIGYVPGPDPCIAGGGYNYCNNGPGARLPAGCTCNNPSPSPEKGLRLNTGTSQPGTTGPTPETPTPAQAKLLAIYKKMNDCLRAKAPYMPVFTPQTPYMTKALVAAEGSVAPSTPIDQVPFRSQLFILETAEALQAQAYHDQVYGPSTKVPNAEDQKDNIVGWLDRCLADAGIAPQSEDTGPDNPGDAYAAFLGAAATQDRVRVFGNGYRTEMLTPLSLISPTPAPGTPKAPAP